VRAAAAFALVLTFGLLAGCSSGGSGSSSASTGATTTGGAPTGGTTTTTASKPKGPPLGAVEVTGTARRVHSVDVELRGTFVCARGGHFELVATVFQSTTRALGRGAFPPPTSAAPGSAAARAAHAQARCNGKPLPWSLVAAAKGQQPLPFAAGTARACLLGLVRGQDRFTAIRQHCRPVRVR